MAVALAESERLAHYYSGVPVGPKTTPWYLLGLKTNYTDFHDVLPANRCSCLPIAPIIRQTAMRTLGASHSVAIGHWADGAFDRLVKKCLEGRPYLDAVVCYENAAEATFRWAKRRKITTILDAASVHHSMQDDYLPFLESAYSHAKITARKDREIALADWVLTTSPLAAESYRAAGVSSERLRVVPMGVDLEAFHEPPVRKRSEKLRLVFVGRASRLKGIDLLLAAHKSLIAAGFRVHLTLIGDREADLDCYDAREVSTLPRMAPDRLAVELQNHDVLVLPSRFDSFGMVVLEAMACGLPAIVSPNVGSKMVIQNEANGLVMKEPSSRALIESINWFLTHPQRLDALSSRARITALDYSWNAYRVLVQKFFSEICAISRTEK
jgi:glycosyltransferase involved in cell wall biosynthesis